MLLIRTENCTGMSNFDAGWMCGELIEEAANVAEQVSIMIFVGRLEQVNARQRRQGLIDYLMKRKKRSTLRRTWSGNRKRATPILGTHFPTTLMPINVNPMSKIH